MAARREKITVDFDPVVVTLDTPPEGIQREGQYGVDYQYILNGDAAIMWVPKACRDAIVESGARKGDTIELCKSQRGRVVGYRAMRVDQNAYSDERQPAPSQTQPAAATAKAIPTVHPITEKMTACLKSAVDSMSEARAYAASKRLELDGPSWEDVRAIALSIYIGLTRGEGK